jgi:hypothetical protein
MPTAVVSAKIFIATSINQTGTGIPPFKELFNVQSETNRSATRFHSCWQPISAPRLQKPTGNAT